MVLINSDKGPSPDARVRSASLLLAVATVAALAVVPDWPHRHLGNPSYWAVVGFLVLVIRLLARPRALWDPGGANRRVILVFLAVVQLIYVANWVRYGGSLWELGIETGGLGIWVVLVLMARQSNRALWLGCAAHGIWDALHFDRVGFVPEWYAASCMAADVGIGAFVLLHVGAQRDSQTP